MLTCLLSAKRSRSCVTDLLIIKHTYLPLQVCAFLPTPRVPTFQDAASFLRKFQTITRFTPEFVSLEIQFIHYQCKRVANQDATNKPQKENKRLNIDRMLITTTGTVKKYTWQFKTHGRNKITKLQSTVFAERFRKIPRILG